MQYFSEQQELSGIANSETGEITRPLPVGELVIPPYMEVIYQEEGSVLNYSLIWDVDEEMAQKQTYRKEITGVLDEFIHLAESGEETIGAFALKWGPLCLCEHFIPYTHKPYECPPTRSEPLWAWQIYAAKFRAILELGARFHRGDSGTTALWNKAQNMPDDEPFDDWWTPDYSLHLEKLVPTIASQRNVV